MVVVFDIDGTLSIVGDRLKYLQETPPNWDAFYGACGEDTVNDAIWEVYAAMEGEHEIYFVTGRRESCRKDTISWMLRNHIECHGDNHLLMRKDGDKRHDTDVKPELVDDFKHDILMIFEDRASMVDKWRELGYTCLQVAEGNF
jgi:predicted secreted acid phosphatase